MAYESEHIRPNFPSGSAAPGRIADVHMWTIRDGWTSRAQAFRDEAGRTFVLITRREGDTGPGHINGAEMFRTDSWAQFFPDDQTPPTLIANNLDDPAGSFFPQIVTIEFSADGIFDCCQATDPDDIRTLDRLGAEWDEGAGYVPYIPPPPTSVFVLRRMRVRDLPPRELSSDIERRDSHFQQVYMAVDWGRAVRFALQLIEATADEPGLFFWRVSEAIIPAEAEVPSNVASEAKSLCTNPIWLQRNADEVRYMNGRHRAEAMLRQGVEETIVRETRLIDAPPLPGERSARWVLADRGRVGKRQ